MRVGRTSIGSRIISMLLVVCMVFGMVPLSAFSVSAAVDTTATAENLKDVQTYASSILNSNFSKTSSAPSWDTEGKSDTWRYFNGVVVDGLLMLGVDSDAGNALEYASNYYDYNVTSDGGITRYSGTDISSNELDSIAPARALFDLLGSLKDQDKYATVLTGIYDELMSFTKYETCGNNFLHKANSSWQDDTDYNIGLDGMYMALPFMMEYANAVAEGKIVDSDVNPEDIYADVYTRLMWVADNMCYTDSEGNVLYHHGWCVKSSDGNGVTWLRGVGWYAAALADVIGLMPEGSTYQTNLIAKLKKLCDGMLAYQVEDSGMWYNVVAMEDGSSVTHDDNLLETSGTALMAYALVKAYNNGWLASSYGEAGIKAFNAMCEKYVTSSSVTGIYQMSGVETTVANYCKNSYVPEEGKGIGPVMMAAAEVGEYLGSTETFVGVLSAPDLTIVQGTTPDYSAVKATVIGSQGTLETVDYTKLSFTEVALAAVGDTEGTVTVGVSYEDSLIGTFNVNVVADETSSATGTVTIPSGSTSSGTATTGTATVTVAGTGSGGSTTTYVLYTGDFTDLAGGTFLIVDGSKSVALRNPEATGNDTGAKADVTITTVNGVEMATVSDTYLGWCEWDFADGYSISNDYGTTTIYLRSNDGKILAKSGVSVYAFAHGTDGSCFLSTNNNTAKLRYYYYDGSSSWLRTAETNSTAVTSPVTYLYKKTSTTTGSAEDVDYTVTLTPDQSSVVLAEGETGKVSATLAAVVKDTTTSASVSGTVTWKSSDESVVEVDASTGEVEAVAEGTATITGTVSSVSVAGSDAQSVELVATIPVTVQSAGTAASVTLTVDPATLVLTEGKTGTFTAEATISGVEGYTANITVTNPDASVATLDGNEVTAVAAGTTSITLAVASITDGTNTYEVSGVSADMTIVVNEAAEEETHTHSYTVTETVAPTCTTGGEFTYTCSCGDSYTAVIDALGHSYSGGECTVCGAADPDYEEPTTEPTEEPTEEPTTETTAPSGTVTYVPATTIVSGNQYLLVAVKDDSSRYVAKHDKSSVTASYSSNTVYLPSENEADCLWTFTASGDNFTITYLDGSTTYGFKDDGSITSTSSKITAAAVITLDATTGKYAVALNGTTGKLLSCDEGTWKKNDSTSSSTYYLYIYQKSTTPTCEHSYAETVTTAATCTTAGVKTYTCSLCGDSYTEDIAALGHSYTSEVTTAATCTEDGVRTYTCQNDTSHTYTETVAATGHTYVDGTCTVCGATEGTADSTTVSGTATVTTTTAGSGTTYVQYFGTTIEEGVYLIVDEGYALSTGSVGSNTSGKAGAVAVTVNSTDKTASFASGVDATPCLWTVTKNSDGTYTFTCVYNETTYYIRNDSSYITSKTGQTTALTVGTSDAANGNYAIDVGSSQYIYYSGSAFGRNGSGSVNLYKQTANTVSTETNYNVSLTISPTSMSLGAYGTDDITYEVVVTDENGNQVTDVEYTIDWSTSDSSIATVSGGTVTGGETAGTAAITATLARLTIGGKEAAINGTISASCNATVTIEKWEDVWQTVTTNTVTATAGGTIRFVLEGSVDADDWGRIDNLKLYQADGTEVSITNGDFETGRSTGWTISGASEWPTYEVSYTNNTGYSLSLYTGAQTDVSIVYSLTVPAGEYYFTYEYLTGDGIASFSAGGVAEAVNVESSTLSQTTVAVDYGSTTVDSALLDGLTMTLVYSDGSTVTVDQEDLVVDYTIKENGDTSYIDVAYKVDGVAVANNIIAVTFNAIVTGGTLSGDAFTVSEGSDLDLSAITMTLSMSDGSTGSTVALNDSAFTFYVNGSQVDMSTLSDTAGTYTVDVYYNGEKYDTLTLTVNPEVTVTDAVTYVLDTDGIDAGAEYLIVDIYSSKYYALSHSGTSEVSVVVTLSEDGTLCYIDEDSVDAALWTFTTRDATFTSDSVTYQGYYISNNGVYVRYNNNNVLTSSTDEAEVFAGVYDAATGQYRILLNAESSSVRDLNANSTSGWERGSNGSVLPVYLFKKVESSTSITVAAVPQLVIGGTAQQTLTTTVMYNGAVLEAGTYELAWTTSDSAIAYVQDGVVYAASAGTVTLTAQLISVNGTDVSSEGIYGTTTVSVASVSIDLGDDRTSYVGDSYTLEPDILIGSIDVSTGAKITWESSDDTVAAVDENGKVTILSAGTATITATLTEVNGNDVTGYAKMSDSMTITAEEVVITGGALSSSVVTVSKGADIDELTSALSGITLTLSYNNGNTVTIDHDTLFAGIDLTAVDTTQSVQYIDVSYTYGDYTFVGTVTVKMLSAADLEAEGIISIEDPDSLQYILDTDGIDANKEYVIVAYDESLGYVALMNPDATGTSGTKADYQVVTVSDDGTILTVTENADLIRWLFYNESTSDGFYTYYISNNNRAFRTGDDKILTTSGSPKAIYTDEVDLTKGQYELFVKYSSSKTQDIVFDGTNFTREDGTSTTINSLYLYQRYSETTDYTVGFSVAPETKTLATGTSFTVTDLLVSLSGTEVSSDRYVIEWTTEDTDYVTVTQDGKITGVKSTDGGTVTVTATLKTIDGETVISNTTNAEGIAKTIEITVVDDTVSYTIQGSPVIVPLRGEADFSGISLFADSTYADDMTMYADDLVINVIDSGLDTGTPGTYYVDVYYNGTNVGQVTVLVADSPYEGLDPATSFATYPDVGAVRYNKTATGINFNDTGVAQIELTAAGVSTKSSVDVVLIVDVSNSMAWSMDWFEGLTEEEAASKGDADKDPDEEGELDKLDEAMKAATNFANILLGSNTDGSAANNTLTFVTFAGQNGATSSYMDSVLTAFVGVEDASAANLSFANTYFTVSGGDEELQIADETGTVISSGANRGNTNYDYAFTQGADAVNSLKTQIAGSVEAYDASERELHVVFMTDGAPSHYNNYAYGNKNDFTQFSTDMDGDSDCDDADWLLWIKEYNTLATSLYSQVDDMHIVGFDLDHGGFGSHSWDGTELGRVLGGLVKSKALEYELASDTEALYSFFDDLGRSLAYAGTEAYVMDIVGADFVLQTAPIDLDGTGTGTETMDPVVQVLSRRLVTSSDIGTTLYLMVDGTLTATQITESHLGEYVYNADGTQDMTVLEEVTFEHDDSGSLIGAYSSVLGDTNIYSADADSITAEYFSYYFGSLTFDWTIENITDREVALTYYAYLTGSQEGNRDSGLYPTNKSAHLTYIDINGDLATVEYPVPYVSWGAASVGVRFYLVNEKGEYVNLANVSFTNPANRIFLTNRAYYEFNLNTDESSAVPGIVYASDAYDQALIDTAKYKLYDDDMYISVTNSTANNGGSFVIYNYDETSYKLTDVIDTLGNGTYIQTTINIPVVLVDMGESARPLTSNTVVIDYGKPMQIDVFSVEEAQYAKGYVTENTATGVDYYYTMELVGFAKYNANTKLTAYVAENAFTTTVGEKAAAATFSTGDGTYEIVDGKIVFTPNGILTGLQEVFVAVKFAEYEFGYDENDNVVVGEQTQNYYYMYKHLTIVPATIVYYETDGNVGDAFAYSGEWTPVSDGGTYGSVQDAYTVGGIYGYDSSYTTDKMFSNGTIYRATGAGVDTTTASFTFTGTGFDIISSTGANQGTIRVQVKDAQGNVVKTVSVINKGENELYQIPVVSVEGLERGTYTVEIGVYGEQKYGDIFYVGNQFCFDAVRIYGTMEGSETIQSANVVDGKYTTSTTTVDDIYTADGELDTVFNEIRDALINANSLTSDGSTGAIFMDDFGTNQVNVTDYTAYGANNEVYLAGGNAVAFSFDLTDAQKSFDLGMKSVDGSSVTANVTIVADGTKYAADPIVINSSTAQFYNLLAETGFTSTGIIHVVISNSGSGILSLTDLKFNGYSKDGMIVSSQTLAAAQFAGESGLNVIGAAFQLEEGETAVRMAETVTLTVTTETNVSELLIFNSYGDEVWFTATSTETADNLVWTVTLRPTLLGEQTYTIYGLGTDGSHGESATATITVNMGLN